MKRLVLFTVLAWIAIFYAKVIWQFIDVGVFSALP